MLLLASRWRIARYPARGEGLIELLRPEIRDEFLDAATAGSIAGTEALFL